MKWKISDILIDTLSCLTGKKSEKRKPISYGDPHVRSGNLLDLEVNRNTSHNFQRCHPGTFYPFRNGKSPNNFYFRPCIVI